MITKEEALKGLNLSDKEINVYLSLLMLGQSSVNNIAKKANLNRISTYDLLKALLERGFVSYVIKSGVRYFEAVEPSKFLDNLKEKQEKIKAVLPELEAIKSTLTKKPQIEMYEEIKGLKSIFNDILKENKETWFIGDPKMLDSLKFYFPHFINQKRKQKIFSKVITHDNKAMREYKAPKKFMEMRFIKEKIEMTKIIYGNKIAFLTFKEKESIGVLINNKDIANTERKLFEILWKNIK
ncbi:TrmB family transcriptional regulator [Candidatus Woesearchaeota archaeon]|jgi:HTH-type transcriptional regulator, sugar sensing transcriptional regulator|nr:TrmB family transcriptional regulator [Candidatus Woesearchaeota archaeon]